MQIVTTCAELKTACGTSTVAQTGFLRKQTNELHQGHINCILACKQAAQLSVVSFFPHEEILNWLYTAQYPLPTSWDQTYCTNFCETHGVDIVFIPTFTQVRNTFFQGIQPLNINNTVNTIIVAKGYNGFSGPYVNYIIAMEYLRKQRNLYPKHVCVFSVKDGYQAFSRKDYYENELLIPCVLVDITYDIDGLPESSSYASLTPETKAILISMNNILRSKTFDDLNNLNDFTQITNDLNNCDPKPTKTVHIDFIRSWKNGIVGANKILLEVFIHDNTTPLEKLVIIKENPNAIKRIL